MALCIARFWNIFATQAIAEAFTRKRTLTLEQLQQEIYGHWPEELWREVLLLLAGDLQPTVLKHIFLWLPQQPDPPQTCGASLLSARCVAEVRERHELQRADTVVLERLKWCWSG
ncbi:MAG: hypothetical protein VKO39_06540 [Cyanobacteriota bacterium]|nr:hypothetical protein [Cyanobacteriota bacterium]